MNRLEKREAIYTLSVLRAAINGKYAGKMETADGEQGIFDAISGIDVALQELGKGMNPAEIRATQNQVKYKTLRVCTLAAHPVPDGDQVVMSVEDINTLFIQGREECVLCERSASEAKQCPVHKVVRKYDLRGVCEKYD